jgi:hypothetical protein
MKSISFLIFLVLFLLATGLNSPRAAQAHEGAGAGWLLSYHVSGDLTLQPDQSLPQWMETKAVKFPSLDGSPMTLMSVNNSTYAVFLVSRTLNSTEGSGVVIAFEGAGINGSDDAWSIIDGKQVTPLDPSVKTRSSIEHGKFTATFGRELESGKFAMKVGATYDSFVKATSWNNGTSLDSINLDSLKHWDLELLPPIDEYPKLPIEISAALVGTTAIFIVYETRRQSH